jgi:outer membrane protein OmpA-like peptidoglycan-associated protein
MKRTVMVTPPTTRAIEIPQKTTTLKRTVLASDARVEESVVPAVTKTIRKEVLTKKGGLTTWKEVDCKLVEYNDLNINWNLGSATLTPAAKAEIDAKLLPVLQDGVSVEIASHTDSRGSKESNRALSERRAQAVTNYLISKGINSSRIVSNGYGESRLTNRCSDGVSCTEREHLANRRTQFRVINQ